MSEREYPVPDFPDYTVTENGEIISHIGSPKKLTGYLDNQGRGRRAERKLRLKGTKKRWSTIVAAAKYQRWPEPHEEVRHMDGDPTNNSMFNLQLGDHLNNIIDDIEIGNRQTSVEQLDLAIARLMSIREKLE